MVMKVKQISENNYNTTETVKIHKQNYSAKSIPTK